MPSQQHFIVARADILHFISCQVISTNLEGSNKSKERTFFISFYCFKWEIVEFPLSYTIMKER